MISTTQWKHQNTAQPIAAAQLTHMAVFDDEQPGYLSIYQTDGSHFYPCRSVAQNDEGHRNRTLLAWAESVPLLDMRDDKTQPLPSAEDSETKALRVLHGPWPLRPTPSCDVGSEDMTYREAANAIWNKITTAYRLLSQNTGKEGMNPQIENLLLQSAELANLVVHHQESGDFPKKEIGG